MEGRVHRVRELIKEIYVRGYFPNLIFYNQLIDGYCRKDEVQQAFQIFSEMIKMGVLPTVTNYGTLINGLYKLINMDEIGKLVTKMVEGV